MSLTGAFLSPLLCSQAQVIDRVTVTARGGHERQRSRSTKQRRGRLSRTLQRKLPSVEVPLEGSEADAIRSVLPSPVPRRLAQHCIGDLR